MTVRTLAEAAADVLSGSQANGAKEPMHKLPNTGSGLDAVTDLGGSTFEDPQGGDVGKAAAAMVGKAAQPGKPGAGADPSKGTLPDVTKSGTNDTDLASSLNKTVKTKMQAVPGGKMAEETEEDGEVVETEVTDEDETELTEEEIETARKARWDDLRAKMAAVPVSEDMEALFSGETLSEEFKSKAQAIFEAAVITRAMTVLEPAEKEILEAAEAAIDETREELEEKVEGYLNFVVEQWVAENTVAIESGLRTEAVEQFIVGLKNLFTENYVDVPEDKVDLVAAQEAQIAELTAKVNEALNANIELTKKLSESKKIEILNTVCEGLTATAAEKVKTLAEGVEFTTEVEFSKKLKVIRESYTGSKVKDGQVALTEQTGPAEVVEAPAVDNSMKLYTDAIARTLK